jgi:tetratricopeptide (TPR) repeat protein
VEDHAETFAHHYSRALELARASGQDTAALRTRARAALRNAGDRAAGLRAFGVAAQFYAEALELWPRDDREWPALRFRQGRALYHAEETGVEVLVEARDALLAAGDVETAAESEVLLGLLAFRAGEGDRTVAHYERALELLEGAPASAAKAWALGALSRSFVVAARSEDGLRVGHEALAMAEELGLDEVKAKALMTIGDARLELGDRGGMPDFRRGIAMAEELGSLEAASGYINLADTVMDLGDLAQAVELRTRAQRVAERLGDAKAVTWLRAERCGEAYWLGRWEEALAGADSFISEFEDGSRHYQEIYCRVLRGRILLARDRADAALDDALKGLEFARVVKDPQALYPALAFTARASEEAGKRAEAEAAAGELLDLVREDRKTPVAYLWLHDLAVALADLGRGDELLQATAEARKPTPWLEAARALAAGDPRSAAGLYRRIGARPDEALARLRAGAALAAAGRQQEAEAELRTASTFYLSVGAEASLAEAERLLAALA